MNGENAYVQCLQKNIKRHWKSSHEIASGSRYRSTAVTIAFYPEPTNEYSETEVLLRRQYLVLSHTL